MAVTNASSIKEILTATVGLLGIAEEDATTIVTTVTHGKDCLLLLYQATKSYVDYAGKVAAMVKVGEENNKKVNGELYEARLQIDTLRTNATAITDNLNTARAHAELLTTERAAQARELLVVTGQKEQANADKEGYRNERDTARTEIINLNVNIHEKDTLINTLREQLAAAEARATAIAPIVPIVRPTTVSPAILTRCRPLNAATRSYSGKATEDLGDWIFSVKENLKMTNITDDRDKIGALANFVRDSPLKTLINYLENNTVVTLEGYFTLLRNHLPISVTLDPIRNKMLDLKQKDCRDFQDYLVKFQTLLLQVQALDKSWTFEQAVFAFQRGLKQQVSLQVELQKSAIKTIEDAYAIASKYELIVKANSGNNSNENNSINYVQAKNNFNKNAKNSFNNKNNSYKNNNNNNNKSHESKNSERGGFDKSKIKCYKCNMMGHMAKDCRVKQPSDTSKKGTPFNSFQKANLACSNMQMKEADVNDSYYEANCMVSVDRIPLMCVTGTVDSVPITMVLDTGATASIMSLKSAKENAFELIPTKAKLKAFTGTIASPVGRTKVVSVTIRNRTVEMSFIVMDVPDYDALLGIDWFTKANAGVFPATNELRFESSNETTTHDAEVELVLLNGRETELEEIEVLEPWVFDKFTHENLKPEIELSKKQQIRFAKICDKLLLASASEAKELSACKLAELELEVTSNVPIHQYPYRRSAKENEIIEAEVTTMKEAGIIRFSKSPYASPALLIRKKQTKKSEKTEWRFCVDYRKINAITIPRKWPIRRIKDILARMQGSTIFSRID